MSRDARAIEVFERYLQMPLTQRDDWVAEAVAGDEALAAKVARMTAADHAGQLGTGGAAGDVEPLPPPSRIGAYRIAGLIGHGGMGSVYRGARDGGDFSHEVAIKLIKPGLLSGQLDARFRAERQVLASLRHPHIAQLYDGGETADGAPYIVMELVDGDPIIDWADEHDLSADARAALFGLVCDAVSFAHRSLIVHRDITPSNILVTRDGVPKLIDFGIARISDHQGTADETALSSLASLSLTPGFAAPERQVSARVTTAADIYSLGKVLAVLIPQRDADLDAVVARASAADPAARYPTAQALADDVAAWRAGRPVAARDAGWVDRCVKFVKRNTAATAIAAAAATGLIAAFALTVAAYHRAETARRAEGARFADLRALAGFMLFDLNGSLSRVVGTSQARLDVTNRAQRYLAGLAVSANADAALKLEAARGFIALALIRGVPTQPNLGQTDEARGNLNQAIALAGNSPDRGAGATLAGHAMALRAMIEAHSDGKPAVGDATLKAANAALARVAPAKRDAQWRAARSQLRRSQLELATLQQKPDDILLASRRLADEIAQWPIGMRNSRTAQIDRAVAAHGRGMHLYWLDRFDDAIPFLQDADARFAALDAVQPNEPAVAYMRAYNGYVGSQVAISTEGREAEGDAFLRTALMTIERLLVAEPNDRMVMGMAGTIRGAQAQALSAKGRHAEALDLQSQNVRAYEAMWRARPLPATANRLVLARIAQGNIARRLGDRQIACAAATEVEKGIAALERRGELIPYVGNFRPRVRDNLAACGSGAALIEMRD